MYLSSTTCNEAIDVVSVKVRNTRPILRDLLDAKYYSITGDSIAYVSHIDQLSSGAHR